MLDAAQTYHIHKHTHALASWCILRVQHASRARVRRDVERIAWGNCAHDSRAACGGLDALWFPALVAIVHVLYAERESIKDVHFGARVRVWTARAHVLRPLRPSVNAGQVFAHSCANRQSKYIYSVHHIPRMKASLCLGYILYICICTYMVRRLVCACATRCAEQSFSEIDPKR